MFLGKSRWTREERREVRTKRRVLADIALMHMIRKDQRMLKGCYEMSFADPFYVLAGQIRPA